MFQTSLFIFFLSFTIISSIPCPPECICKPISIPDLDVNRMSYEMDCDISKSGKLVYRAEEWAIESDTIPEDNEDADEKSDYGLSINLSNSPLLKKFTNQTIDLTGFSFFIYTLSLTTQDDKFLLTPNSFYSSIYEDLQILNLSSCCNKQIPKQCAELFRPLTKLKILDLSGSNMYKTCLNTPDTISSSLRDLILRNNIYDSTTFTSSSQLFNGVKKLTGTLDLQNSRFQTNADSIENCLFDLFSSITKLDLSNIQFEPPSNDTYAYLERLLKCRKISNSKHLNELSLRYLKLQHLPEWFTDEQFPDLKQLDLSNNYFHSIDIQTFSKLHQVSLAYNPIEFNQIIWRNDTIYKSIDLSSTVRYSKFDLKHHLSRLFQLTKVINYNGNQGEDLIDINQIPIEVDYLTDEFTLNISRTNIKSFEVSFNDIRRLDISWNLLTELNLYAQDQLYYLDCSNQYLKNVTLNPNLSTLKELRCSNNSLTTVGNFSAVKKEYLEIIDLSNNSITSLNDFFSKCNSRYLRKVNFRSNSLTIIRSFIFHDDFIQLVEIDLSWNKIWKIDRNAFQAPNLQILDLTGNPLKTIEPKAIFTASLRYMTIFNTNKELTDRCSQVKTKDSLLSMYINWYTQNGTYIKQKQIKFDKCLKSYVPETKANRFIKNTKYVFGSYALFIVLGVCVSGIILGGVYVYRKNNFPFLERFRRYKKIDRDNLVENEVAMDERNREDDEVVMNREEPPFNKYSGIPTDV